MRNNKTGAPVLYDEPLNDRIAIRVTKDQKEKIFSKFSSYEIRELLLYCIDNDCQWDDSCVKGND